MENIILISQIAVSILLVGSILLQQRGTALGSAFGGESGGFYSTRRGIQKKLYISSIVLGIIFIALSVASLIY
jgi:protein translocase SecG subunit